MVTTLHVVIIPMRVLALLVLLALVSSYRLNEPGTPEIVEDPFETHAYTRFPEVKSACRSVLASASKLETDMHSIGSIQPELSFAVGDWGQDSGNSPLMPFDRTDALLNGTHLLEPQSLASFTLTHVDPVRHSQNALNVSGALVVSLSRNGTMPEMNRHLFAEFRIWPGSSELTVLFEGVYTETRGNGGERVLCLLGNTQLPSRQPDSTDQWEWMKDSGMSNSQPVVVEDDKILLVLRYPKTFSLISRAVHGEMRSLNKESSVKYFNTVRLSSQLGFFSNYMFGSERLVSKACSPYPYHDDHLDHHLEIYKGAGFCEILDRFASGEIIKVVPNWNCNSTDEYCSKLGPFVPEQEIRATDGGFANVGLMMRDIRCEPGIGKNNVSFARVSLVLRVTPPWENQFLARQRTGLNNMTLSAEGVWNSSAGQLCMVGCLGLADAGCNSRICLYVPTSFSIKRRNIIFGQISSINNGKTSSYFPLSFELHPFELINKFSSSPITSYKYSKIQMAGAFLERSEPFDFGTLVKKSLLSYPKLAEENDEQLSLSNLSDDLSLHTPAAPDPLPKVHIDKQFLQLEILSLGSLLGRYYGAKNVSTTEGWVSSTAKSVSTERQLLLNVSAELTLFGTSYTNFSVLFLEGLYNQVDGKMYLIGCMDVRASWKLLFESMDLEDGLDCLIEVKVEYPPTTARWLMNPTAKVSIASQRTEDDPLHFSPVKLQTLPILYRGQREDLLSRRGVEGTLRILTLSVAIACILSQLFYIRDNTSGVPYISLVMLGVQALGYSIPLITGAEALFSRMASASYDTPSYELESQWSQIIDYLVKILVLVVFLLTLRLGQKVLKSRIRLLTRAPLEPERVPNDKRILLISLILHAVGFLIILAIYYVEASKRPVRTDTYLDARGNSHKLREWGIQLEEYIGLIQDFFLLPQIIGNFLWQINCKPLRKAYYVGITAVRLLPHVYDYINSPVFNPYFSEQYEFVNPNLDFYSRFGDVAIPVAAILLATIIFVQQKWSYQKLSQTLRSGQKTLLPLGSRVYERLPSMSFEAELVSGVNEPSTQDDSQKNEE